MTLLSALLLAVLAAVTPAMASWHLVGQKKSAGSGVYFGEGLVPGHVYRLVVTGKSHVKFNGTALESYTFVANHRLGVGHKTMALRGSLPHAFTISQPTRGSISGWSVVLDVGLSGGNGVTVRLYDLGKK